MKITYFHRHSDCGFSIFRVFKTIETEIQKSETVKDIFMPSSRSMPWDIIWNGFYTFRHRNKNGINHISGHIHDVVFGLRGCKTVLTIHDLVFIDNVNNPLKRFYKWFFWLYIPIKFADKVTCISGETKKRILNYIKTDKVHVIYNPIDPSFKYQPKVFNVEKPRILHIGVFWNKNLVRTIQALNGIKCHLRIIGKIDENTKRLLDANHIEYSVAFGLTDEEVRKEYVLCDIVNFPTIYEGFGMPIIEGQKTGRVVVTSRIEPLIEISGNAVQYVNPKDIESIREAYIKVIGNASLRDSLIRKGLDNVKRFKADVIANQYLNLYHSLE